MTAPRPTVPSSPPTATTRPQLRQQALLGWFRSQGRDLPWRATRDPWAVLVAEFMLQQTQVARVVPRWHAFLERFPDPRRCAEATVADVVDAWAGLGYNRRAVQLHRAATAVSFHHGGRLPDDLDGLLALPGIGPYTARAVLAFAHERPVGVVDVNAARVLGRWAGRALTAREAQTAADAAVPDRSGWAWNQAVLDLGATVCRARSPRCVACPVVAWCGWAASGRSDPDPAGGPGGGGPRQSRFAGSDRQGRGRLIDALRHGPVEAGRVASVLGWPDDHDRAARVAAGLAADGLAAVDADGTWTLPR